MNKVRQFALLTVVAVFGLFAAGYMLLVKPKSSEVGELNATRASQEQQNKQLEGQIKMLQEQAKKLPAVQAELAAIAKKLPANPEMPALIRSITIAADDAGLTVDSLSPDAPTLYGATASTGGVAAAPVAGATSGSDALGMIPVEFKIHGGYHNMQLFFANLENLPRSFVLHKFSIKQVKDRASNSTYKPGDVEATLNGRVFMAVPATSLPAPTTAGASAAPQS